MNLNLAPASDLTGETLPIAVNQPTVKSEAGSRLEGSVSEDIPRRHILVVENDISQSLVVCGWLRELGQSVDPVFSAEEALEFLEKTQPDVALLDIGLPGMSGTDLAKVILEKYPHIQACFAVHIRIGLQAGAQGNGSAPCRACPWCRNICLPSDGFYQPL